MSPTYRKSRWPHIATAVLIGLMPIHSSLAVGSSSVSASNTNRAKSASKPTAVVHTKSAAVGAHSTAAAKAHVVVVVPHALVAKPAIKSKPNNTSKKSLLINKHGPSPAVSPVNVVEP